MESNHDPAPTTPDGEKQWWLDDPANVKKLLKVFFIICGVLFALDLLDYTSLLDKETLPGGVDAVPGFFGIYGCVGCVVLVLVAKQMRKVLMRPEDYYDR